MSILIKLQALLDGKKTYLTGGAMVLTGLANHNYSLALQGLSVMFLRSAIAKS